MEDTIARKFNWKAAFFMLIFHIGAGAALYCFQTWWGLLFALPLSFLANCTGIAVGFHRLLTHRGFNCPKWVEYLLAVCGCLALQGGPIGWVARHRKHHADTDRAGDPHTPTDGLLHAYIGWIIMQDRSIHAPEFVERQAHDLIRDPVLVWIDWLWWLPTTVLIPLILYAGGLHVLLWSVCIPVVFGWHAAGLVNTVCHRWGTRPFDTKDNSRNSWWVAVLTWGEGFHNTHHGRQFSPCNSLQWYQFDPSWYFIWLLKKLGLAYHLKV